MNQTMTAIQSIAPMNRQLTTLDIAKVRQEVAIAVPEADPQLDSQADTLVNQLLAVQPADLPAQQEQIAAVEQMGLPLQQASAHRSQMLKQPINELAARGADGGPVANALVDLTMKVEELDPSHLDFGPGWKARWLGFVPGIGNPLKRYFLRYESAQEAIDAIVRSLENGRDQLRRDTTTLANDQVQMRQLTQLLAAQIALARIIDGKLQYKLDRELPPDDDPMRKYVAEELLFPLRQRIQDLQQQLALNQQGVLAIELIIRTNKELVRGVDRAINVTVSALSIAVTVALAEAHQRIQLDKINALNKTTDALIAGTAARLRSTVADVNKQASMSMLNMDTLKQAFVDIHTALEDIAQFRQNALPQMAQAINEMAQLTNQGENVIRKMEKGDRVAPKLLLDVVVEETEAPKRQ